MGQRLTGGATISSDSKLSCPGLMEPAPLGRATGSPLEALLGFCVSGSMPYSLRPEQPPELRESSKGPFWRP